VLALDDGEYAKIAMLDYIVDAGSTGTNNWLAASCPNSAHSRLHGGTLPVVTHCILMGL
jgi:hypothetical protein